MLCIQEREVGVGGGDVYLLLGLFQGGVYYKYQIWGGGHLFERGVYSNEGRLFDKIWYTIL